MTRQEQIIKDELQEAQYIGEDGGMVVDRKFTRIGAYRKMLKRYAEDTNSPEDFKEWCKPDDIGIGWIHLATEKQRRESFDSDTEWYVSVRDQSPYEVWVYWG